MTITTLVVTLGGVVLIAGSLSDLLFTVLHPTRSGAVSRVVMAMTWRGARAGAERLHREALLGYAGPAMMLAQLGIWILGLWLGFALIYTGHLQHLAYAPSATAGRPGPLDAGYLSGAALTTVGFGDIVADTTTTRLLTVAEAASGLAVFGAAIAYLLAVYPLVSQIRTTARQLACVRHERDAAELAIHGGPSRLESLQRDLIQLDESTQRFPVLYYFHAHDPTASLASAVRAATLITLQLRFGLAPRAAPFARWHGEVLDATLTRVIDHFHARYHRRRPPEPHEPATGHPDQILQVLRRTATQVTGTANTDPADREALATLLIHSNTFLADLARKHLYSQQPLSAGTESP